MRFSVREIVAGLFRRMGRSAAFGGPGFVVRGGGGYDSVRGYQQRLRRWSRAERTGEDGVLPANERARMINLMRDAMRNAPVAQTLAQQRRVNVVGPLGGKLTLSFPDPEKAEVAKMWEDWFNTQWAPQCEFTDGLHLNELLKLALSSQDTAGDVVLVFDDGVLCNSGRIRAFEADEIGSLPEAEFRRRMPAGWTQSQGRISDSYGRGCGVIVSTSQRGLPVFDPDACLVLTRDPAADRRDCFWTVLRSCWRFNQGRGVSPLAAAIQTLTDLHEITASETAAAKMNAKMVGQLLDDADSGPGPQVPADYLPPEDPSAAASAAGQGQSSPPADLSFRQYDAIGAVFDLMPPKMRMELFDTKRPNQNMPAFLDWLTGQVAGVFGQGRVYATLNPDHSYTAFRGAQCLSWPSFAEAQKHLERHVLDWAVRNAFRWAVREKILPSPPPEGWERAASWSWPSMPEVNEVDAQTALDKKIANNTLTYREILGPSWEEKLEQVAREKQFFRSRGMTHPSDISVSGAVVTHPATSPGKEETQDGGRDDDGEDEGK